MSSTTSPLLRKVEISLLGQRFQLRSDKSDEYLQGLARFVSERLESIQKNAASSSVTQSMALLLCLNLADQLFEKEEELRYFKTNLEAKAQEALKEVQAALATLPEPVPLEVTDEEII